MQSEDQNKVSKYPGLAATPFEEVVEFARRILERSMVEVPGYYRPMIISILKSIHNEMIAEEQDNEH